MKRTYDIFEIENEQPIWRVAVSGHEAAVTHMRELAAKSSNEFRLLHVPTGSLVAVIDAKGSQAKGQQLPQDEGKTHIVRPGRKRKSTTPGPIQIEAQSSSR